MHRMPSPPSPRLIVAASRPPSPSSFLRSCLFHLPAAGTRGAEILPVSRNPAAPGSRPRPPATVPRSRAAFVWDPEEKQRELFSGFTAPEKVLAHPQPPARGLPSPRPGTRSVPFVLCRDTVRAGTAALVLGKGEGWRSLGTSGCDVLLMPANGSQDARRSFHEP